MRHGCAVLFGLVLFGLVLFGLVLFGLFYRSFSMYIEGVDRGLLGHA